MGTIQDKFADIIRRLSALPYATETFVGCIDTEIEQLESYANGELPCAYRHFLRLMGHKQGKLFKGSDSSLDDRFELRFRRFAEKLLERKGAEFSLPAKAFVFLMHQGYQYLYFVRDEGDDPPVYLIGERNLTPKKVADSFTEYLSSYVSDLERVAAEHPENFKPA
jgi:hypothetical protein